MKFYYN